MLLGNMLAQAAILVAILALNTAASYPYNPTRLFQADQNGSSLVYVLNPPSDTNSAGCLSVITLNSTLHTTSIPQTSLSTSLPFLEEDNSVAYTPTIRPDGSIVIYTGHCNVGVSGSEVWIYTPDAQNGQWLNKTFDVDVDSSPQTLSGANFLASAISFQPNANGTDPSVYIFGGMCPFSNSTDQTWTTNAAYSDQMLLLRPENATEYDFTLLPGVGEPIAEAGFSITPLQPTFSSVTDGSQTQQQSYLLLGGHTQSAFINMSQVALFSLPQTTWTFLPIDASNAKIDLLARDDDQLEPRSGHTAVLSSDGTQIVVLGGWVGDVTTPANPQLMILDVGLGYGGSGDWSWSTAPTSALSLPFENGIFGHGATMLPGNIMMVMGGQLIGAGSNSRLKRANEQLNSDTMFFNLTSGSWTDTYVPMILQSSGNHGNLVANHHSHDGDKIGLGVGLTLGLLLLIAITVMAYIYVQRLKRRHLAREQMLETEIHEKELGELSLAASWGNRPSDTQSSARQMRSIDGSKSAYPWATNGSEGLLSNGASKRDQSNDAERTGIYVDIPSPTRGLRRSLSGRAAPYIAVSRHDDGRHSRTSGNFPTIEERDEEEVSSASWQPEQETAVLAQNSPENPFNDPIRPGSSDEQHPLRRNPTLVSRTGSSSPAAERQQELSGWIRGWAAAGAGHANSGSVSPEKSDRTGSNLSERSTRSTFSSRSGNSSGGMRPGSSMSSKNTYPTHRDVGLFIATETPSVHENMNDPRRNVHARFKNIGPDSFSTAHTDFGRLEAESELLLGQSVPGNGTSYVADSDDIQPDTEPTFTRNHYGNAGPVRSRSKVGGWMLGSVRRAFPTISMSGVRSSSMTSTSVRPFLTATGGLEDYSKLTEEDLGSRSGSSSPRKRRGDTRMNSIDGGPKRSVSDGAAFALWSRKNNSNNSKSEFDLSRKKGRRGTVGDADGENPQFNVQHVEAGASSVWNADDWDPEDVIEEPVVKVTFTVPKEKLRVINTDDASNSSEPDVDQANLGT